MCSRYQTDIKIWVQEINEIIYLLPINFWKTQFKIHYSFWEVAVFCMSSNVKEGQVVDPVD